MIWGCWLEDLAIILAGDDWQYGWNGGRVRVHADEGTPKYIVCSFHYRTDVLLSLSDSLHLGEVRYSCSLAQHVFVLYLPLDSVPCRQDTNEVNQEKSSWHKEDSKHFHKNMANIAVSMNFRSISIKSGGIFMNECYNKCYHVLIIVFSGTTVNQGSHKDLSIMIYGWQNDPFLGKGHTAVYHANIFLIAFNSLHLRSFWYRSSTS